MAFSRDDLKAYEAQPAPKVESAAAPEAQQNSTPATETNELDASDTSSVQDVSADLDDLGDDGTSVENEDSTTSTAETDGDTLDDAATGDSKPVKHSRAQERIADLVEERNATRKFGEYMTAKVKELEERLAAKPAAAAETESTPIVVGDEPPTLEQHSYDPVAFSKAQSKWLKEQVQKGVQEGLQQERTQQDHKAVIKNFEERAAVVRAANKDFDVIVANPNLPKLAPVTANAIVRSELGPRITYHLGKNVDLATRIARMAPEQQLTAIGRIEGELAASAAKPAPKPAQKKTVTNAPPPPKPTPAGSAGPNKDVNTMSMAEFVAFERSQKLAEREASLKRRRAMR